MRIDGKFHLVITKVHQAATQQSFNKFWVKALPNLNFAQPVNVFLAVERDAVDAKKWKQDNNPAKAAVILWYLNSSLLGLKDMILDNILIRGFHKFGDVRL